MTPTSSTSPRTSQAFADAIAAAAEEFNDPRVQAAGAAADALAAAFGKALDAAYASLPKVDPDAGALPKELILLKGHEKALSEVPAPAL